MTAPLKNAVVLDVAVKHPVVENSTVIPVAKYIGMEPHENAAPPFVPFDVIGKQNLGVTAPLAGALVASNIITYPLTVVTVTERP